MGRNKHVFLGLYFHVLGYAYPFNINDEMYIFYYGKKKLYGNYWIKVFRYIVHVLNYRKMFNITISF